MKKSKYGTYMYGTFGMKFMFGNTYLCLGWLKSDLGVVLLCFGFNWKISREKEETDHF